MSCYEWEAGEIKLPTAIFAKFRKEFIEGYNQIQQRKMDRLKSIRERAILGGKGKRGYNYEGIMLSFSDGSWEEENLISQLFADNNSSGKPKAITKKMFTFANGKTFGFDIGEGYIGFKKPCVGWSVSENNHACESAHNTQEAKLLFRMLNRVVWTRGSGGVIVGNDEYNRDDYNEGGGANYTKMTFGKRN